MNVIEHAQLASISAGLGAIMFRDQCKTDNEYAFTLECIGAVIAAYSDDELLTIVNECLNNPTNDMVDIISDIFESHHQFFEATSTEIARAKKEGRGIYHVEKDFSDHNKKELKKMTPSFIRDAIATVKRSGVAKAIRKGMNNSELVQQAKKAWHGSSAKAEYKSAKDQFSKISDHLDKAKKHGGKGTGVKGEYHWSRYLTKSEDGYRARLRAKDHKKKYDLAKRRLEKIKQRQHPPHVQPVPVRH